MIDGLAKTETIKDPDGKSMLTLICKTLYEEDNEFIKIKNNFEDVNFCLKVSFEDLKKEVNKAKNQLNANKGQFDMIC